MMKVKKYKKQVFIILGVFILLFIPTFLFINLTNPTKINKYIASVVGKSTPSNSAFDDQNFYNCVVDAYNKQNNASTAYTESLTDEQLKTITSLSCDGFNKPKEEKIASVMGLEKLVLLTSLDLDQNNLSEIDVSNNISLKTLRLWKNNLTSIDVSKNTSLTHLDLSTNDLLSIDISKNTSLTYLSLALNNLTSIDVSRNTSLTHLSLRNNNLTSIDVSKNTVLTELLLYSNELTEVDVSNNTTLTDLRLSSNELTEIDVSKNTSLTYLDLCSNNLTSIDVSDNIALTSLELSYNDLTLIDVSKNTALTSLYLRDDNLMSIDVSKNTALTKLNLNYNELTEIDVSKNTSLMYLDLSNNDLTSIDISKNTALTYLHLGDNNLSSIDLSKNISLEKFYLYENPLKLEDMYVKKGNVIQENSNIKLPKDPENFYITYEIEDKEIANYENGKINGLEVGKTNIIATLNGVKSGASLTSDDIKVSGIINVYDITSEKYIVSNNYIYTKQDTDTNTILTNIIIENGGGLTKNISNNKLQIKNAEEILEEIPIVNVSSNLYNLNKDYIYIGAEDFDKKNILCTNCTLEINNNELNVKVGSDVVKTYKLVSLSSNEYRIFKDYIYIGEKQFEITKITCINCELELIENKLNVKVGSDIVRIYDIVHKLKGDINSDGEVTALDVALLYRHVRRKTIITDQEILLISDINNDGQVTIIDVSLMYRYVKSKTTTL